MVTQVLKDTFLTTYRDDWRESDGYYRILFNNGRALQARELTQLQTILQNQITKNSNFTLKDGAAVSGGNVSININDEFVKLNTAVYTMPASSVVKGDVFTGASSGIKAKVTKVVRTDGTDPHTLYVKYIDNGGLSATSAPLRFQPGELITGLRSGITLRVQTTNTAANQAVGRGSNAVVGEGTWYTSGHFVYAARQTITLSKYSNTPTVILGYIVNRQIITSSDDADLYDNSGPNPNVSAPGADRYKISLTLALQTDVDSGDVFIKIADIQNGIIVTETSKNSDNLLSTLGDIMARRTYEESGNYIVRPFSIYPETNDSDANKIDFVVRPGVAYVEGYRVETLGDARLTIDKPRTTELFNNQVTAANYGNYTDISTMKGLPKIFSAAAPLTHYDTMTLKAGTNFSGASLGTTRVKAVEKNGAGYRMFLFDVDMSGSQDFRTVRSIGADSDTYANIELVNSVAVINDATNNNSFFDLQKTRPSELSDISLTVQRLYKGTTNGSGSVTFTAGTSEVFDDTSLWITAVDSSGAIVTPTVSLPSPFNSVTLSALPFNSAVSVAAYVQRTAGSVKTKTLTNRQTTYAPGGSGTVTLDRADIYRVNQIRDGSSTGTIITNRYDIDNGQTDNFYDVGKLFLKSNATAPAGNVWVDFDYFEHGATGDFFAVNSYTGQIPYENIPAHRQANGDIVELRDVLDFRSRKDNTGANFTGTGARAVAMPRNTDLINFDARHYQSVKGRIFAHRDGYFVLKTGKKSATLAQYPDQIKKGMELYNFTVNPYMLSDSDIFGNYIEYRHYTMNDIGKLEDRIDELEELTTLTLLELQTSKLQVLDSAGLDRTKAGFTADGFTNHVFSDTKSTEYRASIDPLFQELRPNHVARSIELVYDSSLSSNVILKGDTIYMNYTDTLWKEQPLVSREEQVNTFAMSKYIGDIIMSPASDVWKETENIGIKAIPQGTDLDVDDAVNWGKWNWGWKGYSEAQLETLAVGNSINQIEKGKEYTTTSGNKKTVYQENIKYSNTIKSSSIKVENRGDVIVNTLDIAKQRSHFFFFKAEGLRPNTRYFPFYAGKSVADWVNTNTAYQAWGSLVRTSPYLEVGNVYKDATQFPSKLGGPTASIVSSADGEIEGVFLVPNTSAISFSTGRNDFVLIDISVLNFDTCTSYAEFTISSEGTLNQTKTEQLQTRVLRVVGASELIDPTVIKTYNVGDGGDGPNDGGGDDTSSTGGGGGGGGQCGGSSCFLTTAIVDRRGEADDGPTLTKLRNFRDSYMKDMPNEVSEYYQVAPIIVSSIPTDHSDWAWIGEQIDNCCKLIDESKLDDTYICYRNMVNTLKAKWMVN